MFVIFFRRFKKKKRKIILKKEEGPKKKRNSAEKRKIDIPAKYDKEHAKCNACYYNAIEGKYVYCLSLFIAMI